MARLKTIVDVAVLGDMVRDSASQLAKSLT